MVKKAPVKIWQQIILCLIPYLWIYGFYRINKLQTGLLLTLVTFLASIGFQLLLPFPYGLGASLLFGFILTIYFMTSWSNKWNNIITNKI